MSAIHISLSLVQSKRGVFINCPWDEDFAESMDAIVLATVACGFEPRSLKIEDGPASARIERICTMLSGCAYSIHDLSRCKGQGDQDLARANMPLELGVAVAWNQLMRPPLHDWLVMVPKGSDYLRYVSDLGGFDPKVHEETAVSVAQRVFQWLRRRDGANLIVGSAGDVTARLADFTLERQRLQLRDGEADWWDLIDVAVGVLGVSS